MKQYKNSERTKKWIRNAFIELLSEKKSLNKITINELVEKADITKTTFYYHYQDIYGVAEEIENEIIQELSLLFDDIQNNIINPDINNYITRITSFLREKESDYRMVINSTDLSYFIYKIKRIISNRLDLPNLGFSKDKDLRIIQITFFSSACVDTIVEYYKGNLNCTLDQVEEIIKTIIRKLQAN